MSQSRTRSSRVVRLTIVRQGETPTQEEIDLSAATAIRLGPAPSRATLRIHGEWIQVELGDAKALRALTTAWRESA